MFRTPRHRVRSTLGDFTNRLFFSFAECRTAGPIFEATGGEGKKRETNSKNFASPGRRLRARLDSLPVEFPQRIGQARIGAAIVFQRGGDQSAIPFRKVVVGHPWEKMV